MSFLRKVVPNLSKAELNLARSKRKVTSSLQRAPYWEVETGSPLLFIEGKSGLVTKYTDHVLYGRCYGPDAIRSPRSGRSIYRSERDLIAVAQRKLKAIGWDFGPVLAKLKLPTANRNGEIPGTLVYL